MFTKGVNVIGNFRKVCDPIKENVKASRKGAVVQFFGSSGFFFRLQRAGTEVLPMSAPTRYYMCNNWGKTSEKSLQEE